MIPILVKLSDLVTQTINPQYFIGTALSLSRFYGHFPGEPGLAGLNEAKDDGSGADNWSYKTCKAPVKSSPPTNQLFIGQMPFLSPNQQCQSTEGKGLAEVRLFTDQIPFLIMLIQQRHKH